MGYDDVVLARLNERFRNEQPGPSLHLGGGVLIHQFDLGRKRKTLWEGCMSAPGSCKKAADRFSASLINRAVPHVFRCGRISTRPTNTHGSATLCAPPQSTVEWHGARALCRGAAVRMGAGRQHRGPILLQQLDLRARLSF